LSSGGFSNKGNCVNAQPNPRFAQIDASQLTAAFVDSEIIYLDSPTDYRELLQDDGPKESTGEFILQDDQEHFPWRTLMVFTLALGAVIVIIFIVAPMLGL
jgi:hypothetical protein